jgi:signal transduction histidine kinase/ActR/RegA family two-component response regulator
MATVDPDSLRVLILAPIGRDGPASADILKRAGVITELCADLPELVAQIAAGAAAVFVAEEALFARDVSPLHDWVERQPPWSDLPFVILTSRQELPAVAAWRQRVVASLRNVSLLERPVQSITLTSTVRAAVRARRRQYEIRAFLEERERAAQELEALVVARTRELEAVNDALRTQMAERAQVEETLRQAQKIEAIGRLTGGVAHDFNNLLMVLSGGLDMLERHTDPVRQKRLMDSMRQAAARGAGLTRQLLAFARRQPLQPVAVDLAHQIGGMRELLDRSLRGDVNVALSFADNLWPVEVDPGELELVVLNLAVNARDAMPVGGTIEIRAENLPAFDDGDLHGDFVRLAVVDTGVGMSPEVKARVFEPFFTTKEIGKGSGLGLAQAYGFAQQSGGSVRIESELGRGTSVMLLLPRSAKVPAAAQHALIDVRTARPATIAGRVLLVEDDHEVAALVTDMLDQLGYDVIRVASAAAALGALANGRRVDLVFSDIMMPGGMNGVDLAKEIHVRRGDLPVLLTSGYAEAAKRGASAEGVRVLPKPYRLDELAVALKVALKGHDGAAARV